ncbi:cell division control protein [Microthyrium microscopicum]|uniref:Cell division control protein n=1 Tax=Microthyrium microscopicum TaxID=703497 RepID=A0A6A6U8Q6_9PEZI|nr:cell division control protein [Microthyrium microscopicum]
MPTVKGGVWTNIEDEILKAAISKYGLNQWARVSSLLARKTSKQCKARWDEWLDPSIRKIEWSREEDEKLLHLAKLMPTQWRTIAPIVGRTANQCLERYNKLLDDAQAREDAELGLAGPGDEASAPTADDVRRLRPGEVDPDPESKPARPDTIDMDEDEKEMLSEARARLANTQGKKAKRKARERQLEESRRVASLQKRRELKMSGINIKLKAAKKGEMDYNADIPFERPAVPGFYDTTDEQVRNEKERDAFDPRKQQLAIKRKGGPEDEQSDNKRKKTDKAGPNAGFGAAMKAAQAQKIREAEQMSKRRGLVLPAPQVGDSEMEDIVKMGLSGERASSSSAENHATKGLIGNYNNMTGATPIRTPRAAQEEDRVANEIANIRALNETQSALLGGENNDLIEGSGSTGFEGAAPSKHVVATPNPMATPFRQANGTNGAPSATPLRTPRDNLSLNRESGMQLVGATPRDIRLHEKASKQSLMSQLAALPKPKESEWELELPEEQDEMVITSDSVAEDSAARDRREKMLRDAAELSEFKAQSMVVQQRLPRPTVIDLNALLKNAKAIEDPFRKAAAIETAHLIAHDAAKFGGGSVKVTGTPKALRPIEPSALEEARRAVQEQLANEKNEEERKSFTNGWSELHCKGGLPGMDGYYEDEVDEHQMLVESLDELQDSIGDSAKKGTELEKKLSKLHGGYIARSKMLKTKIADTAKALENARIGLNTALDAQAKEDGAISRRLEKLRDELAFVSRREREEQEIYRNVKDELSTLSLQVPATNGVH